MHFDDCLGTVELSEHKKFLLLYFNTFKIIVKFVSFKAILYQVRR